jgi:hypothetical protein
MPGFAVPEVRCAGVWRVRVPLRVDAAGARLLAVRDASRPFRIEAVEGVAFEGALPDRQVRVRGQGGEAGWIELALRARPGSCVDMQGGLPPALFELDPAQAPWLPGEDVAAPGHDHPAPSPYLSAQERAPAATQPFAPLPATPPSDPPGELLAPFWYARAVLVAQVALLLAGALAAGLALLRRRVA